MKSLYNSCAMLSIKSIFEINENEYTCIQNKSLQKKQTYSSIEKNDNVNMAMISLNP